MNKPSPRLDALRAMREAKFASSSIAAPPLRIATPKEPKMVRVATKKKAPVKKRVAAKPAEPGKWEGKTPYMALYMKWTRAKTPADKKAAQTALRAAFPGTRARKKVRR